ncbi:ly6/PLAUR domain-containing protein 8 [Sigmodon hispidus]
MKSILIAGVFAAFAITVIDSLSCRQCEPFNSICNAEEKECDAESRSCVESSVNSTLGGPLYLYNNKFCSKENCSDHQTSTVAFVVRVFDEQRFHFVSQCCQGEKCNDTSHDSGSQAPANTKCNSCYSYNTTTCSEKTQECFQGEQCVHIIALVNDTERINRVELKGCSDITSSTCQALSSGNVTVGEFIFQSVQCTEADALDTTTSSTTTSTGIKVSFTSSLFGSLLLLKLLMLEWDDSLRIVPLGGATEPIDAVSCTSLGDRELQLDFTLDQVPRYDKVTQLSCLTRL